LEVYFIGRAFLVCLGTAPETCMLRIDIAVQGILHHLTHRKQHVWKQPV